MCNGQCTCGKDKPKPKEQQQPSPASDSICAPLGQPLGMMRHSISTCAGQKVILS